MKEQAVLNKVKKSLYMSDNLLAKCLKSILFSIILCLLALPSCARHAVDMRTLNNQVQAIVKEAEYLIEDGKIDEGLEFVQMARQLHPDDPKLNSLLDSVPKEKLAALERAPMLGFNKAHMRAMVEPTTLERFAWYIPDRIKDTIDIFGLEVNFGPQIGAGVWATRAVQANAYAGTTAGLGLYQKTGPGGRAESSLDFAIGPAGGTTIAGSKGGIYGYATTARALTLHKPSHDLYQEYRDYWAVGGKMGLFFIGFEGEIHPVEIFDWLGGWAGLDPLHDDWATTRKLIYTRAQEGMVKSLFQTVRDAGNEGLEEYKRKYPTIYQDDLAR